MTPPITRKHVVEISIVAAAGLFCAAYYHAAAVRSRLDVVVTPAVQGLTGGYSSLSTFLNGKTGLDLGLVQPAKDPAFDEAVRLATFVNERSASSLIDIACDKRYSDRKRNNALQMLLKFSSSADWIQPLLNELPKGGMISLYQRETPTLDMLFRLIREEGGVQQPLVRAYAELVFSFMLQAPDGVLRSNTLRWLSDVLPEDALPTIASRIPLEKDEDVRHAIEMALLDVRVVPKPELDAATLFPFYRNPPWENLKVPLAIVLARLGDAGAVSWLKGAQKGSSFSDREREGVALALAGTRYPAHINTEANDEWLAKRKNLRHEQAQAAVIKRDRLERQEKIQLDLMAKVTAPETAAAPEAPRLDSRKPISMSLTVDRVFTVVQEGPMYSSPGEGRLSALIPVGTEVKAAFQATAKGHTWYQISTAQGPLWVDANLLETPEQSKFLTLAAEGTLLEVADARVDVYAAATDLSRVVGSLGKGHVIHVLRADKVTKEQWFEVQLDRGSTGWIRGDLSLRLKVTTPDGSQPKAP